MELNIMTRLGLFLSLIFQTVSVITVALFAGIITKLTITKGTQ